MERLTEKTIGCFEYSLKDHKAVPGEFGTYEAFFDYSMAVRMMGKYEDTGLMPEEIEAVKADAAHLSHMEKVAKGQMNQNKMHMKTIEQLQSELAQVKEERDSAVNCIFSVKNALVWNDVLDARNEIITFEYRGLEAKNAINKTDATDAEGGAWDE